jgi:hypothetical protein
VQKAQKAAASNKTIVHLPSKAKSARVYTPGVVGDCRAIAMTRLRRGG